MDNNRQIKFRLVLKGKIVGYEKLTETGWKWMWLEINPDVGERWTNGVVGSANGIIRDRFTGLTDKEGKEIYEGDRLAEISKLSELEKWGDPLTVEFGQYFDGKDYWGIHYATTGFFLRYKDGGMTGLHSHKHGGNDSFYGFCASEMLIVGTIHQ